jgi:hypothetical protein
VRTCIHCVLFRAATYAVRRRVNATISFSGAAEACWLPGGAEAAYRRVRDFLGATLRDDTATRLRLLSGARPDIHILAISVADGRQVVDELRVPRYADERLALGFAEAVHP